MTVRNRTVCCVLALLSVVTDCGKGPSPTAPSTPQSFLAGTWSGTLTIEREGEPTISGPVTWTFEVVPRACKPSAQRFAHSTHGCRLTQPSQARSPRPILRPHESVRRETTRRHVDARAVC